MVERQKQELADTLKVEDGFEGMQNAQVLDVKDVETKYGKKAIMTVERPDTKKAVQVFLNVASVNNMIDAFGTDDETWIAQMVDLKVEMDEAYNKKKIVVSEHAIEEQKVKD